jgi:hypothetical protein
VNIMGLFNPGTKKGDSPLRGESPAQAADQTAAMHDGGDPLQTLIAALGDQRKALDQLLGPVVDCLVERAKPAAATAAQKEEPSGALAEKLDYILMELKQLAVSVAKSGTSAAGAGSAAAAGVSEETMKAALRPLLERMDQLDVRLKAMATPAAGNLNEAMTAAIGQVRQGIAESRQAVAEQKDLLTSAFRQLWQQVETIPGRVVDSLRPPEPDPAAGPTASSSDWEQAVLGRELAEHPGLSFQRQQLIAGVLEGNPGAGALAGQLLVFQSAPAEKMPQILKDIGEAYYRWQPKVKPGVTKMEEILVHWLQRTCDEKGIPNTIELVNPGERFDSARHNANRPGVEITEVHGWIVLRDNGKVYTKAAVSVK